MKHAQVVLCKRRWKVHPSSIRLPTNLQNMTPCPVQISRCCLCVNWHPLQPTLSRHQACQAYPATCNTTPNPAPRCVQISKVLLGDDSRLRLPRFMEDEAPKDPEQTKQDLIERIAQLNASIDEVASQLKVKEEVVVMAGMKGGDDGMKIM